MPKNCRRDFNKCIDLPVTSKKKARGKLRAASGSVSNGIPGRGFTIKQFSGGNYTAKQFSARFSVKMEEWERQNPKVYSFSSAGYNPSDKIIEAVAPRTPYDSILIDFEKAENKNAYWAEFYNNDEITDACFQNLSTVAQYLIDSGFSKTINRINASYFILWVTEHALHDSEEVIGNPEQFVDWCYATLSKHYNYFYFLDTEEPFDFEFRTIDCTSKELKAILNNT